MRARAYFAPLPPPSNQNPLFIYQLNFPVILTFCAHICRSFTLLVSSSLVAQGGLYQSLQHHPRSIPDLTVLLIYIFFCVWNQKYVNSMLLKGDIVLTLLLLGGWKCLHWWSPCNITWVDHPIDPKTKFTRKTGLSFYPKYLHEYSMC